MNQTKVIEKGQKQANRSELKKKQANISNKNKEALTRREIENLMGCNRQTYHRVGGAVRNKR